MRLETRQGDVEGSIVIEGEAPPNLRLGHPYRLSVNLVDGELHDDDCFFVQWSIALEPHSALAGFWRLGLVEDTHRRADAGYVGAYGALWRFARCADLAHEGVGDYKVCCIDCRLPLKKAFERQHAQRVERALARDAAARLRGLKEDK
jgi:hypothetical protein